MHFFGVLYLLLALAEAAPIRGLLFTAAKFVGKGLRENLNAIDSAVERLLPKLVSVAERKGATNFMAGHPLEGVFDPLGKFIPSEKAFESVLGKANLANPLRPQVLNQVNTLGIEKSEALAAKIGKGLANDVKLAK